MYLKDFQYDIARVTNIKYEKIIILLGNTMKTEKFIIIILFLIFVALSGCINQDESKLKTLENEVQNLKEQISELEKQRFTPSPTTSQVESINLTSRIPADTYVMPTPSQTIMQQDTLKELPKDIVYVSNEMKTLAQWGNGRYELKALRVTLISQHNSRLSIKSQIISGEEILEEQSLILEQSGSSYSFSNEKQHLINNTNVTLRLWIEDYEPIDYLFRIVTNFN